ncbi:fungal-specific transcription factor domain-containing protein [Mycena epipterygia]|nr:fungal-specific transcription factor domain-containing protein [Mycena epipterygia]
MMQTANNSVPQLGALSESCAECRRLKLKCDKTVPCSSCKRRGCATICPNGSLITGQGTRFVLADTEKLHTKVATMSDRIRQLEDGLAILQSTVANEPHPLLTRPLLNVRSAFGADGEEGLHINDGDDGNENDARSAQDREFKEYIDAVQTPTTRGNGGVTYYGRTAGSENLLMGKNPTSPSGPARAATSSPSISPYQATVASFASSFPFSSGATRLDLDYLKGRLPPYTESLRLSELYLVQSPWFFGPVMRAQVTDEILPLWFPDEASRQKPKNTSPKPLGSAHDLALIYAIFCIGALGDADLPFSHNTTEVDVLQAHSKEPHDSEYYYRLTKAALTLEPILAGPPNVAMVQTLALIAIYEVPCAGENTIARAWPVFGLATKLAQSIGLHRDCAKWPLKLTPAEVQKRRALFWELFIADCWQALATGRLPTFSLPFVDCELPQDVGQTFGEDREPHMSFSYWKARYGAECLSAVVQGTLTAQAPTYSLILELDGKVRDVEYATDPAPEGLSLPQNMNHFMRINYRHSTLLYIHRCFFTHAVLNHPSDPLKSPYGPSFLAGYRSACELLESLRLQFNAFPPEIARFWPLWTHAFSSAIMLSSIVIDATKSKVAPVALLELGQACELFQEAAKICPKSRAAQLVPILQRVSKRAEQVFEEANDIPLPIVRRRRLSVGEEDQSSPPNRVPSPEADADDHRSTRCASVPSRSTMAACAYLSAAYIFMVAPPFIHAEAAEWNCDRLEHRLNSFQGWVWGTNAALLAFSGALLAVPGVSSSPIPQSFLVLSGIFSLFGFVYTILLAFHIGERKAQFASWFLQNHSHPSVAQRYRSAWNRYIMISLPLTWMAWAVAGLLCFLLSVAVQIFVFDLQSMSHDHADSQPIPNTDSKPAMLALDIFPLAAAMFLVVWSLGHVFMIHREMRKCNTWNPLRQNSTQLEMGILSGRSD